MNDYTATDIRILRDDEVAEQFDWAKAGALAAQYNAHPDWVRRGIEACTRAGVRHSYFVDRYLRKQPVPLHEGVDQALRDILLEQRGRA